MEMGKNERLTNEEGGWLRMDYRTRKKLEKLEEIAERVKENAYIVDLMDGQYSVLNAVKHKYLGEMSPKEFEAWTVAIKEKEPNSVIIIDDIPWD